MITSLINILLIDRDLSSYINKFTINMLLPITQEDLDRRDTTDRELQNVSAIMNLFPEIEDNATRLKMSKSLISNIVNNSDFIDLIQDEIDKLDNKEQQDQESEENFNIEETEEPTKEFNLDKDLGLENNEEIIPTEENEENTLPTPEETGVDLINNID